MEKKNFYLFLFKSAKLMQQFLLRKDKIEHTVEENEIVRLNAMVVEQGF